MNYLEILWFVAYGALIISICGFIVYRNRVRRGKVHGMAWDWSKSISGWSLIATTAIVVVILTSSFCAYQEARNLPFEYKAACQSVTEIEGLLMRYDNIQPNTEGMLGNLGEGLEAYQLKLSLGDAMVEKNRLWFKINAWKNNPMMPYRDILAESMLNVWA